VPKMKIKLTRDLEISEISSKMAKLDRKVKLSKLEESQLKDYKKAYRSYEESGEVFYFEEFTTELTLNKFRKVFTTKRLEILNQLNKIQVNSISELARVLKRDVKNVYEDLQLLNKFNLIKLNKLGKNTKPELDVVTVTLEFFKT
jgi:predicted transcriptional regulator